jgi:signal recognition particle subunit SRP54
MFDSLQDRLNSVFDRLRGRGALAEGDVDVALNEIRNILVDADVALPVVKNFIAKVRERAVGEAVIRSVTPGQQVVKIVYDTLVETLGTQSEGLSLGSPPAPILMVGLQGSGKTTTSAKLASLLQSRDKKRVLMASIAAARVGGYDVVILDTAGRQHIDEALMAEVAEVKKLTQPHETLLVADSLTGQDAVNIARTFNERVQISGIILTRADGDQRGGAALSMREVTGAPIKFLGTGEKLDALEPFHPARVASRILDLGDVVSLVEKAVETVDRGKAEKLAKKLKKGDLDFNDLAEQLSQMRKMGGMQGLLGMLPGVGRIKDQLAAAGLDDRLLKRQEAIISSMTRQERTKPDIINGSRRKRIAAGAGVDVPEVNKVLKMQRQMADVMKKIGRGGRGMMQALGGMNPQMLAGLGGGGMPPMPPGLDNKK